MSGVTYEDDPSISDDCDILRRIPSYHFVHDNNLGITRPSSAAFENDKDGQPMSVALKDELDRLNLSSDSVLEGHEGFGLASFKAGLAREFGQLIVRDPLPEQPAHGLVCGNKTKSISRKFAKGSHWEFFPEDYPGKL